MKTPANKFTPKQKDLLSALGILSAMVAFAVSYAQIMIWSPELAVAKKNTASAVEESSSVVAKIRVIDGKLSKRNEILSKANAIRKVASTLPQSIDAPGFLNNLANALQAAKIDYRKLKPEAPSEKIGYTELPYSISCDGRYHDLGQFLNLIENNPVRFMRVKGFEFLANDKRPSVHPVDLSIGTFFLTNTDNKEAGSQ